MSDLKINILIAMLTVTTELRCDDMIKDVLDII